MNILFVCNQNQNRSKTAEKIFEHSFQTKSSGLYCKNPLDKSTINWCDVIIVMEEAQGDEIANRFPRQYLQKRVLNFDIPDIYHYNNPHLIKLLQNKMQEVQHLF